MTMMSIRPRRLALAALGALVLLFGNVVPAPAAPGDNLPVYTSPIDATGLTLQLRVAAPDRETGKRVDIALPVGLSGPKMNQMFSTPLSTQIDRYWNATPDPKTGMTARAAACDGKDGIKAQLAKQIAARGSSYSAYDIVCNLAATGQLLVQQTGSTLTLAYLLKNSTVSFTATSPDTCHAGHGSPFCPNDPKFTAHFATELVTVIRTPGLCQITAENGTVNVVAASIESQNGAAAVAKFLGGQKFVAAETAMTNTVRTQPLPIDAAFSELRTSDACTGKIPALARVLTAFRDLEVEIGRQAIIIRASHVGITPPALDAPNPGGRSAQSPSVPSFTRPTISTSQPLVTVGTPLATSGRYFPPAANFATALPVTMQHGAYGPNSAVLGGGVCLGGATELRWGPAGGPLRVVRLPGTAQGYCAPGYAAANLKPSTAYQFSARDCDPITCSPWSPTRNAITAKADAGSARVVLSLDGGTPLGAATVDTKGTFETSVTIPPGTLAGAHTMHAVNGDAKADVSIQVIPPPSAGRTRASIIMVGLLRGETGCPNHPISSTQTGDTFTLFGSGLAAGPVTIRLDTVSGATLGTAVVRSDGTFCGQMRGVPGDQAGAHSLAAVQNGTVAAQTTVTFVLPSGVR